LESYPEFIDVIRSRRSIGKCSPIVPDRDVIEQVLEAATWAPNHKQTEPWRFVVLSGQARADLGDAMGRAAARDIDDTEAGRAAYANAVVKPLRAPYVIAVYAVLDLVVPPVEEIAATAAAVQNMLLAAHALGLAAMWRTGDLVFSPEVREFLGMPGNAEILGTIYIGYANMAPPVRKRRSIRDVTEWRGDPPEDGEP
jgi:nitroreductase